MHSFGTSQLSALIGQAKSGARTLSVLENELMQYLDSEERTDMIFRVAETEDTRGRFFCLLLLHKAIFALQTRRNEQELDRFIEKTEALLVRHSEPTDRMETAKLASLYSTLALIFWPAKVQGFIEHASALLQRGTNLGILILTTHLRQASDSLDITEERRYEIKKSLHTYAGFLLSLALQNYGREEGVDALAAASRLGMCTEEMFESAFSPDFPYTESLYGLLSELSLDTNSDTFARVSAYLLSNYQALVSAEPQDLHLLASLVEGAAAMGSQSLPKISQSPGAYDQLLREVLRDSSGPLRDAVDPDTLVLVLKVYTSRVKGYAARSCAGSPPQERAEDIAAVLGQAPGDTLLSICILHVAVGSSANDVIVRALDAVASALPRLCTAFLESASQRIPVHASEALLRHAVAPLHFESSYLKLRQCIIRREYSTEDIRAADLRVGKECSAVKECLEGMERLGRTDVSLLHHVYNGAMEAAGYYSLDLAVSCAVMLGRKDLVLHTMRGFEGKGVAAFVAAITKCPEIVQDVFRKFQEYFLAKQGDLTSEIDAISKVLNANRKRGTREKTDAVEVLQQPIIEKIFAKIDTGSLHELKKISKLLGNLRGEMHTAFVARIWLRARREMGAQEETGNYADSSSIQSLVDALASDCSAAEAQVLYEIIEHGEYPVRGALAGIKKILETGKKTAYSEQIEAAAVQMLVSIYVDHTEETVKSSVVTLLTETPERISVLESVFGISLAEVREGKEKRTAMKRVLRRIEGQKEKQGALFQKKRAPKEEAWANIDVDSPFI